MPFPVSEAELSKTEQKMGVRFPEAFRRAMMIENGGAVRTREDDWDLYPFFDTSDRKRLSRTANDIVRETVSARDWPSFPADGVAIASNGCGDLLLFRKAERNPAQLQDTVYAFWHETGEITVVAESFNTLRCE